MPQSLLPDPPGLLGRGALAPLLRSRPLLATRAACGFPPPAEGYFREEERLDLNELLIANPPATFFARADCGRSIVDFGIQPEDIRFGLIDGNSFYVSCERVWDPGRRGVPAVVLGNADDCAITSSVMAANDKSFVPSFGSIHSEYRQAMRIVPGGRGTKCSTAFCPSRSTFS